MSDWDRQTALVAGQADHGLAALLEQTGIHVQTASDGAAALKVLRGTRIDFLFADVLLPGMECTSLFRTAQRQFCQARPCCAVTCVQNFPAGEFREWPVLTRPYAPEAVGRILSEMLEQRQQLDAASAAAIERLLSRLGVPEHPGRRYLCQAIGLTLLDSRLTGALSRRLYPAIAALYDIKPAQVERAIRRCIDKTWSHGPVDEQYRLFGNTIDAQRGKPAIGQMIARCADILRLEEFL